MASKILTQLLNGNIKDTEKGVFIDIPVKSVVIESGLIQQLKDYVSGLDIGSRFVVVCDANTQSILAHDIFCALGKDNCQLLVFPDGVRADMIHVEEVIEQALTCDAVIAVGSGTINDICKYASFKIDKPYMVFATAPSMNGYSSANASITVDGYKTTLQAHLPVGIFLDLDILSAAPKRLICSGLGDSLCRSTAQNDWKLSHMLFDTPYKTLPFDMLEEQEHLLLLNSAGLVRGDKETIQILAETLILSGFGMYICGGSYPASQGEHMIAHCMEMTLSGAAQNTYHGEQIGVTTLTMSMLQRNMIEEGVSGINFDSATYVDRIYEFFGHVVGEECISEYEKKLGLAEKMHDVVTVWPQVVEEAHKIMMPANILEQALQQIGAPTRPAELGWGQKNYEAAVQQAKYTRDRFTFLDLS